MNKEIFLKWLKINVMIYSLAFIIAAILAFMFPDVMLGFVRDWGARSIAASGLISGGLFLRIVSWNIVVMGMFFVFSLFILAPIIAAAIGVFYSLGFMSAIERGLLWHPLLLIFIESCFVILTISFASALGSEIFGVKPDKKGIVNYWKKNWKRLIPERESGFRNVLGENMKMIILFAILIFIIILIGAWIEVFL